MSKFRLAHLGLFLAAVGFNMAAPLLGVASYAHAEALRPEVGKPMQAASELMKAGKHKEALAKVREADAIGGKTAYESFTIDRMRAALAAAMGDNDLAVKAYEAVINSGRLSAGEQIKYVQAVAGFHYRAKDYAKAGVWINRYLKEGGDDPQMRALLVQVHYLSGDCARAMKDVQEDIRNKEKSGRAPSEDQLQLLANCSLKQNDKAAYVAAIEKLVTHYPKKEYWSDLMNRLPRKAGFSDRLTLDVSRLRLALGDITKTADYMEMAQLSLQEGYPAEALKVVEAATKSGAFGAGAEAARQKRLADLATKSAADQLVSLPKTEAEAIKDKDGNVLVNIGYAYVTIGQIPKGIALMEQGIGMPSLKRPEEAKLHLGLAYAQGGQKPKAIQMFKTVKGTDGAADLAKYWTAQLNHPLK